MRDTQSQGADDLRARLEEAERDGAKLQGLNQRLAARVAELEKSQEAGKAPAMCTHAGVVSQAECPYCRLPQDGPACECCQCPGCVANRAALSAPCPLRAELAELRAEHESAGSRWAKTFIENDALRAELAAATKDCRKANASIEQICDALDAWGEWDGEPHSVVAYIIAEHQRLRARVETLKAALTQIRELDYANAAVNCAAYEAIQIARAALKEGK